MKTWIQCVGICAVTVAIGCGGSQGSPGPATSAESQEVQAATISEAEILAWFEKTQKGGSEEFPTFTDPKVIKFGDTLVSEGAYGVAKGTLLFPVKLALVQHSYGAFNQDFPSDREGIVYFYRDEFGDWKAYWKQQPQ
jgi:hypothetical protein